MDKRTICGNGVDLIEECLNMPSGIKAGEDDGEAEFSEFGRTLKNTYDEIFSTKSTDSNIMRENANINADTPMGSMLKIGSESVKAYADRYTISKRFADLHKQGYLHAHDKDFLLSGTTTCASADDEIKIMDKKGTVKTVSMSFFDDLFIENSEEPEWQKIEPTWVLGRYGWTPIIKIMRRQFIQEKDVMYKIKTYNGLDLKLTEKHRIPAFIKKENKQERLIEVKDLSIGDELLHQPVIKPNNVDVIDIPSVFVGTEWENELIIDNITKLVDYLRYQYNITHFKKLINSQTFRHGARTDGYITLEELTNLRSTYNIPDEVINTLTVKAFQSKSSFPIYMTVTPQLARFMGYIFGDGNVNISEKYSSFQVSFINTNQAILEDFLYCARFLTNKHVSTRHVDGKDMGYCFTDKLLTLLLFRILGYKRNSGDMRIPDFIMNGSDYIKYSFLSALIDTDGHVYSNGRFVYSSVCKSFVQQVAQMLTSLGIEANFTTQYTKGTVARFKKDNEIVESIRNYDQYYLTVPNQYFEQLSTNLDSVKYSSATAPSDIHNNTYRYIGSEIKSIDKVPYEGFVYDIETGEHWFSVNGYVVHNCCQIDIDALFERGFSTGHGFLRTPNDVQSYTALTCIAIQSNQNDQHGGQSVPNFDYAIAKGVAKTFIKEYKLAMMAAVEMRSINPELQDYKTIKAAVENLIGIAEGTTKEQASLTMSPVYKSEEHKGIMALGFDSETATKIQDYSYATAERETDKKTYQAMEALIHNLNTMQCLPGSERIWVKQGGDMHLMSMEEINNTFSPNKYEVLSINSEGRAEWKYITASQRKDNNRRLITLTTRSGQRVRVTDNHTVMTTSPSDNHAIVDVIPEDAKWLLSVRAVENIPARNSICVSDGKGDFLDTHVVISEELAELFGIYTACGYCADDTQGVLFDTTHRPNNLKDEYITDLLERSLGECLQADIRYRTERMLGYKLDQKYCRMFQKVCGAHHKRRVPSQILLGADYIKRAFLRGFYATGVTDCNKEVQAGTSYLIQSLGELPVRYSYKIPNTPAAVDNKYDIKVTKRTADKLGLPLTNHTKQTVSASSHDLTMIWDEIRNKFGSEFPSWKDSHSITLDELGVVLNQHNIPNINKYLNFYCSEVVSAVESNSGDEYVYDISVEDNENFMTEDCIFVHNSRAGSQVPFSSINYGTDTTAEGRMVIRNLLEATQEGLGRGETPIFPVQVFKVKDGVNYNPGDPNYDLFKLAMETSAKRLFPNFTFLDAPFNLQYYKSGHPETEVATMGCVSGNELIKWHSDTNASARTRTFGETWNIVTMDNEIKIEGDSLYVEPDNMFIYDSSVHDFVKVKKVIKNPNQNNWYRVSFDNTLTLVATADHPLPVEGVGRTYVENIKIGDRIPVSDLQNRKLGGDTVEVVNIERINYNAASYDVETETDRFDVSGICSHNCRTRVMGNFYDPTREIAYGRGNLSFTSMNLPRLAIEVDGDVDAFFERLDKLMDLTIAQLDERVELQMRKHVYNFPMLMGQGVWIDSDKLSPSDELGDILLHGSISVGFIGLAETLRVLTGQHHGESEEAQELGLRIVGHMRSKLDKLAQERRRNYTLLATPAEGLSGRFVNIDRERFGVIEGVTDREYYTNSFHIPVYYEITAYDKIRIEAPYHNLCNAGHISYVELDGNPSRNMESYESIIRCMHDAGIGYGSVNFPLDTDPVCGYRGVIKEGNRCPRCGRDEFEPIDKEGTFVGFTRIRRVTGYLSGDYQTRFNDAKQAEVRDRVKHGVFSVASEEITTPIE